MRIISVVGARPNFMKIAPFIHVINEYNNNNNNSIEHILVHTGQHYDDRMSKSFFEDLNIPEADINLNVGSGSHAEQVGNTMIAFEKVVQQYKPDWIVVVGDVNATLACAVVAKKEWVKCCHIEAGLRSGDIKMPEEVNRLVTDKLSDLLLTPDNLSSDNLRKEGVLEDRIVFVGNIMIDTLNKSVGRAKMLDIESIIRQNVIDDFLVNTEIPKDEAYALITLHRPSNVDDPVVLSNLISFIIDEVSKDLTIIWPIHPRTLKQLKTFGIFEKVISCNKILLLQPLGYFDMLRLNMSAKIMLTDSGGLQEECTVLGTPCLTLRWNTERPITLKEYGGMSVLVGNNIERIRHEYQNALASTRKPEIPPLWDGNTASRCLEAICNFEQ